MKYIITSIAIAVLFMGGSVYAVKRAVQLYAPEAEVQVNSAKARLYKYTDGGVDCYFLVAQYETNSGANVGGVSCVKTK